MEKRIIEINGIKMELDLRTATVSDVETFCVGDLVKILIKEYSETYKSYAGVIVGFDNFKENPTISVLYIKQDYSKSELMMEYINSFNKNAQIIKASEDDIGFSKDTVLRHLNKQIENSEMAKAVAEQQKDLFLKYFNKPIELHEKQENQVA